MFRFRTICLELVIILAMSLSSATCFADKTLDTPVPKAVRDQIVKMYDTAAANMKLCSPTFAAVTSNQTRSSKELVMAYNLPDNSPKTIMVTGDVFMQVQVSSMRWVSIVNEPLFLRFYGAGAEKNPPGAQTIPTLAREAAIERAREYLKSFKIDVPPDYKLQEVNFNDTFVFCWHACWYRFSGQYPWDCDDFGCSAITETISVRFHEKEGLVTLGCGGCCPAPKRLEVKITKEEAIAKATQCVPLLQRTSIYRSCRLGGFVVKSVKSCELRVSVPNWWLDPKRAVEFRQGQAPPETRLCWRIWLETKDSKREERRQKGELGPQDSLMAPEMFFWIDAATGEVVGANSS